MKRIVLCLLTLCAAVSTKAQIVGPDSVCAGYIYNYSADVTGALTYTWTFPSGWYVIGNSISNAVQVMVNEAVGEVCVQAFGSDDSLLATSCMTTAWGNGGGWIVNVDYDPANQFACSYAWVYYITSNPACLGNCSSGTVNPNVVYGVYNGPWPGGTLLGFANGIDGFFNYDTIIDYYVYIYEIDTTNGMDNAVLITGGNCDPVDNVQYLLPLGGSNIEIAGPTSACVGQLITLTATNIGSSPAFWTYGGLNDIFQIIGPWQDDSVAILFISPGSDIISVQSQVGNIWRCGSMNLSAQFCIDSAFTQYSSVVCPGYAYNYAVDSMAGAVSYEWTLPQGWYMMSGAGTNAVQLAVNTNVGMLCVTGYDVGGATVGQACMYVTWGSMSGGFTVTADQISAGDCNFPYVVSVHPTGPPGGTCGSFLVNPNVIFAVYDNPWPSGNFLGWANGTFPIYPPTSLTAYVYKVDTFFGLDSIVLIGGIGGGAGDNSIFLPVDPPPPTAVVSLYQSPSPVCIGEVFSIGIDPFSSVIVATADWESSNNVLLEVDLDGFVTGTVLFPGSNTKVYLSGADQWGCPVTGVKTIVYQACASADFQILDTSICVEVPLSLDNMSQNAASYAWSFPGSNTPTSTAANPQNIFYPQPGEYLITLTAYGVNNTTDVATAIVTVRKPLHYLNAFITNSGCTPTGNITLNLLPSNGTPPYQFQWSNGATTQNLTNIIPAQYAVTVTDAGGCTASSTATLVGTPFAVALNATSETCDLANGVIQANVTGGTLPYTYLWSNNDTTPTPSGLPAGTYALTVTSADGCTAEASTTLTNLPPPSVSLSTTPSCAIPMGTVDVSTTGFAPFLFAWSNGETFQNLVSVPEGDYTVTVTDANGCVVSQTATVESLPNPTVILVGSPTTCGNANGSIVALVESNAGPFDYAWSNGAATPELSAVQSGTYDMTLTDANGCTAAATGIVQESSPVNVELQPQGSLQSCYMAYDITLLASPLPNTLYIFAYTGPNGSAWVQYNAGTAYQPNRPGTSDYWVIAVDTVTGCVDTSNIVTVTLHEMPDIVVTEGPCIDQAVLLTSTANNPSYIREWVFDGNDIPGADAATYYATQDGWYYIRTIDTCGVTKLSNLLYVEVSCVTGVDGAENFYERFSLFPNPNNGFFRVSHHSNTIATLQIIDITGRIVNSILLQPFANQQPVHVNRDLPNGVYAARLLSNGATDVRFFVIDR